MLKADFIFLFSPLAFLIPLQTSIFKASKRTTGASLSLTNDPDKTNPLPDRHRTQLHLLPKSAARSTVKVNDPAQKPLNRPSADGRKPMAIVARRSVEQ